ncbi:hypothetical protein KPL35_15685 [Clostridium sp. CF011]|uniref:tetratricopeptide repeat protein n=1 Tax=Clostridium sp. CF011 TaxID=2843318 RepID=UPI001C0C4174|nr:hypothetical protein [Clostridium sp. CF011]MBU3093499.1 hypothetical protein [Clostridium sp. CF011]WAG68866.1 hypothetical protein LL036_12415 [Clostridium sp. CF011]
MLTNSNEESSFQNNIKEAINEIKSNKYNLAHMYLYAAMIQNDHSAEVYNLLGVISEYKGDAAMACKYYRASYVFDPTYKPADRNLEKLTSFFYIFNEKNIDYGDNMEKENQTAYFNSYKGVRVGHFKNNETGAKSRC